MHFADKTGLGRILLSVEKFHGKLGDFWMPAPLLEELVRTGKSFKDLVK